MEAGDVAALSIRPGRKADLAARRRAIPECSRAGVPWRTAAQGVKMARLD
jgi:hypothetical protein